MAVDAALEASADAGNDAATGDGGCSDFNGAFTNTGTCSVAEIVPFRTACVSQTGCSATVMVENGPAAGTVVGNVLTFQFDTPVGIARCNATLRAGGAVDTFCDVDDGFATCNGTAMRATEEGASRWCCSVRDPAACSMGEKCTGLSADGSAIFTACRAAGTLTEGQSCTRSPDRAGHDECGPGLYCANYNNATTSTRTCQRLCAQNSDCRANESCISLTGTPRLGLCSPRCTYGGNDCAAGTCRIARSWPSATALASQAILQPYCVPIGTGAEWQPCRTIYDCEANLVCGSDTSGVFQCRRPCTPTLACPMGSSCSSTMTTATNPLGAGVCLMN